MLKFGDKLIPQNLDVCSSKVRLEYCVEFPISSSWPFYIGRCYGGLLDCFGLDIYFSQYCIMVRKTNGLHD